MNVYVSGRFIDLDGVAQGYFRTNGSGGYQYEFSGAARVPYSFQIVTDTSQIIEYRAASANVTSVEVFILAFDLQI